MTTPTDWFAGYHALRTKGMSPHVIARKDRCVYCITEGHGLPVKFGVTGQPKGRLAAFQCATWRPIFLCWMLPGTLIHEGAIKHLLADRRMHGEWYQDPDDRFKAEPLGLEAFINAEAAAAGFPPFRYPRQTRPEPLKIGVFAPQMERAA